MSHVVRRLALGAAVCGTILTLGYLFFVLTASGQEWDNAGYFGREAGARWVSAYDRFLLGEVRVRNLVLAAGLVCGIGFLRRSPLSGFFAAGGMAVAIEGAEFLKRVLPRSELAVPPGPVPFYFSGDTYPSGHTTVGTAFVLAVILVSAPRWRPWVSVVAGLVSASYATGVLLVGWHRPSDAIGGIVWSGLCMMSAAGLLAAWRGRTVENPASPRWQPVVVGCVAVCVIVWAAAAMAGNALPDADAPFVTMTAAIVVAAFVTCTWFARATRNTDWH